MEYVNNILSQIIVYMVTYALASLGIVIGGRTGIFNISGEGAMLSAASLGFAVAFFSNSWILGLLVGAVVGGIFAFLLVYIHESWKVNQFIIGIALVIFGSGISDLIYKLIFGVKLFLPESPPVTQITIPGTTSIPIVTAFINQNAIVYITYIVTFIAYYIFYKTRLGLNLRAIGEDPKAADVVGVNVRKARYVASIIGGMLIGIAGVYLPLVITGTYTSGITNGRGFMAIGIAIFASWRPERTLIGALIFAAIEVIAFNMQLGNSVIPYHFLLMMPFLALLLIMIIFKKSIEYPAGLGKPYSRE